MRKEKVFFEKHGVQAVQDLEGGSHDDQGVDFSSGLDDVIDDHDHIDQSQANHAEPEGQQLHVGAQEGWVELPAVEQVHDGVARVALGVHVGLLAGLEPSHKPGQSCAQQGQDQGGGHQVKVLGLDHGQVHLFVD